MDLESAPPSRDWPRNSNYGLSINTSGIGRVLEPSVDGPASIQVGDQLVVSGPIGRHGLAILAAREELDLQPPPESDCANLWPMVDALQNAGLLQHVRAMRDATRGGVAAVLHEWSAACNLTLMIDEARLPVTAEVRGGSELFGMDPIYIANEGAMLLAVDPERADSLIAQLRRTTIGEHATVIGTVQPPGSTPVRISSLNAPPARLTKLRAPCCREYAENCRDRLYLTFRETKGID